MKKMSLSITTILFALFSLNALCAPSYTWFESKIKWIYPQPAGDFILVLKNSPAQCDQENDSNYLYVQVGKADVTAEGSEKMYSAALMAAATNKNINVSFDKNDPQCFIRKLYIAF